MSEVLALGTSRPDYSYIDHVVRTIRISAGVLDQPVQPLEPGPLLSIHLQSNRPDNFTSYMENLVGSADDPSRIEVVVKIDDTDVPMNKLLPELVEKYKDTITLKFISTPLVGGFFELWRSMNDMLKVCHPHAYFLWNMNDEMAVLNKGWDTALTKYVGMFPDHLFRLRTSVFRSRNYYDYWECGFAPETSAITTKRWLDICGDWNPCLGPDSFNQCVAYYLGYHDRFYKLRVDRDIPVHDFVFSGEGAFIGMSGEALYRRARGACKAWYRLMSHEIQQEASHRAQRLMANIWAQRQFRQFRIDDNTARKRFEVYNLEDANRRPDLFPYKLSKIRIGLTNMYRATAYYYYAGGGVNGMPHTRTRQVIGFLALRFNAFNKMRGVVLKYRKMRVALNDQVIRIIGNNEKLPVNWDVWGAYHRKSLPIFSLGIYLVKTALSLYAKKPSYEVPVRFEAVDKAIDWSKVRGVMGSVNWPIEYSAPRVQMTLIKYSIISACYEFSGTQMSAYLQGDPQVCGYLGIEFGKTLPHAELAAGFREVLREQGRFEELESIVFTTDIQEKLLAVRPALDRQPVFTSVKQAS